MKFLSMPGLIIILVIVLLIFGPKNLPKLGGAFGKTVKNLRDGMGDSKIIEEADDDEDEEDDEAEEEVEEEKPVKKKAPAKKTTTVKKKVE